MGRITSLIDHKSERSQLGRVTSQKGHKSVGSKVRIFHIHFVNFAISRSQVQRVTSPKIPCKFCKAIGRVSSRRLPSSKAHKSEVSLV